MKRALEEDAVEEQQTKKAKDEQPELLNTHDVIELLVYKIVKVLQKLRKGKKSDPDVSPALHDGLCKKHDFNAMRLCQKDDGEGVRGCVMCFSSIIYDAISQDAKSTNSVLETDTSYYDLVDPRRVRDKKDAQRFQENALSINGYPQIADLDVQTLKYGMDKIKEKHHLFAEQITVEMAKGHSSLTAVNLAWKSVYGDFDDKVDEAVAALRPDHTMKEATEKVDKLLGKVEGEISKEMATEVLHLIKEGTKAAEAALNGACDKRSAKTLVLLEKLKDAMQIFMRRAPSLVRETKDCQWIVDAYERVIEQSNSPYVLPEIAAATAWDVCEEDAIASQLLTGT